MDEIVVRAMRKWPDVPNVFGWLRLDRRGSWLVKGRSGTFERIGNAAVIEFIGRNYLADEQGRWFFQNGPQRVFVTLDYLPYVYRLRADGKAIEAHTGGVPSRITQAWLDDAGALVLLTDLGPGVLLDRDLPAIAASLDDTVVEQLLAGQTVDAAVEIGGQRVRLDMLHAADAPAMFGFDPSPRPAPGQPEC